jgi:hypothetical protein
MDASHEHRDTARDSVPVRVSASARVKQALGGKQLLVDIDGTRHVAGWGHNEFMVEPGDHLVSVAFRYCGGDRGKASRRICVRPGDHVELTYRSPYFMFFSRGDLAEKPVRS